LIYTDLTSSAGFSGINCSDSNGTYQLIGGYVSSGGVVSPKLIKYSNESVTDLSSGLINFSNVIISSLRYNAAFGFWLIYGIAASGIPKLNKFDGTTFFDLTTAFNAAANGYSRPFYNNVIDCNDSYWLISTSATIIVKYDGNDFAKLTLTNPDFIFCIKWCGNYWLIGGLTGELYKYDGASITDLSSYIRPYIYLPYNDYHQQPPNDIYYGSINIGYSNGIILIGSFNEVSTSDPNNYAVLLKADYSDPTSWANLTASVPYSSNAGTSIAISPMIWTGEKWLFLVFGEHYLYTYNNSNFTVAAIDTGSPFYVPFSLIGAYQGGNLICASSFLLGNLLLFNTKSLFVKIGIAVSLFRSIHLALKLFTGIGKNISLFVKKHCKRIETASLSTLSNLLVKKLFKRRFISRSGQSILLSKSIAAARNLIAKIFANAIIAQYIFHHISHNFAMQIAKLSLLGKFVHKANIFKLFAAMLGLLDDLSFTRGHVFSAAVGFSTLLRRLAYVPKKLRVLKFWHKDRV
jgi:hypothetical protein